LLPRLLLFADQGKLEQWAAIIREKVDRELIKAADLDLGLDDDAALDAEPAVVHELRELRSRWERHPDGYYQSKDGHALVVVVHTNLQPGDIESSRRAPDQLRAAVAVEAASSEFNGIHVDYAGDMTTGLSEYGRVRNDLLRAGGLGLVLVLVLVLGAIYLYFLRMPALLALGVTILAGCAWTFASTQLTIGAPQHRHWLSI
jgi:hypothetical protein